MNITPTQMKALRDMIGNEYDGVTAPCSSYRPATIGALVRAGLVSVERRRWKHNSETKTWGTVRMADDDQGDPDILVWRVTDAGRVLANN